VRRRRVPARSTCRPATCASTTTRSQEEREAQRLRRAALGHGEGLRRSPCSTQPQHRGPGVAGADARRALSGVALSLAIKPARDQSGGFFGLVQPSNNTCCRRARCSSRRSARRGPLRVKAPTPCSTRSAHRRNATACDCCPMAGRSRSSSTPGREHRGDRRPRADPRRLAPGGIRAVLAARRSARSSQARFSGQSMMSVWPGSNNGLATADMSRELAPVKQSSCSGHCGEPRRKPRTGRQAAGPARGQGAPRTLRRWQKAPDSAERRRIWRRCCDPREQQFTIGTVTGTLQPVVVSRALRNVPPKALYNWDPGAYFGITVPTPLARRRPRS